MDHTLELTAREQVIGEFLSQAGWGGARRAVLAADASFRRYDRLWLGEDSAVLMDAPPPLEDVRPFLFVARHLQGLGYSAPRILAEQVGQGLLLLEDLGDATFTRLLAAGADEMALYASAVELLIDLHRQPPPAGLPAYSHETLLAEAMLLPDWYLPAVGMSLSEAARAEYQGAIAAILPLADLAPATLVLRDFHVDNLMRIPGRSGLAECGLLDFQDAVIGPASYDLASLLEDARRDVAPEVRQTLRARYLAAFPALNRDDFDTSWACLAAIRHAKVIGIFTRLCKRDGKPGYLRHIDRLWPLLDQAVAHPGLTPLQRWLDNHVPAEQRITPTP